MQRCWKHMRPWLVYADVVVMLDRWLRALPHILLDVVTHDGVVLVCWYLLWEWYGFW